MSEPTVASDLPEWQPFFAAGEYRRALAAARLRHSPALDTLEALFDFQEALRGRQYAQAQRRLEELEAALERCPSPEAAATLRRQLVPEHLRAALGALLAVQEAEQKGEQQLTPEILQSCLQPALDEPLTRAEALNVLGIAYAKLRQVEQASAQFDAARQADAQHYRALSNLGNMAFEEGRLDEAEALQRQALALNGDFATAHHNLGVVLRKKGQLGPSVSHIKKAQRLSQRQALQERPAGLPGWLTLQNMRLLGLALAVLLFFVLLRGHH